MGARRKPNRVWAFASAGLAAAAALLLWRILPPTPDGAAYDGVKGREFALQLISDQNGPAARTFQQGERFKVEVSCPVGFGAALRILVFQGDERFEPLPAHTLRCANRVVFPGAFTLDGSEPVDVCLYAGTASAPARDTAGLVCTGLTPNE